MSLEPERGDAITPPPFGVRPHRRFVASGSVEGDVALIRVVGEMDLRTADDVIDVADELLERGAAHVVLECSELSFIDSSGLAVLIRLYQQLNRDGGTLGMRNCDAFTRNVLEVTGLRRFILDDAVEG
ncbi:MAG: anti-sigma factor antagonist [Acidimicrobiales bacterium]|nr:anti-sigma factor antagonist [Acidimicrobiales bacterium]